uniref:Uncharacterized protein AlNc14C105G6191 n=1 Tax=Albugo laibachii Nc14 TaxID=890382 RepID=F0WHY4_9STRA|nr:conserved hypothetical protein [Albugo laibachii Nc14]|eukprot:CCA20861.1 conserved hypothetical protein [Albugo laibachii Nc14]
MSSKLDYLQRYMSHSSSKTTKKKTRKKDRGRRDDRLCIIDENGQEDSPIAPEIVEQNWEQTMEEEEPLIVDNTQITLPQNRSIANEQHAKPKIIQNEATVKSDSDVSPPRKSQRLVENDDLSPVRRRNASKTPKCLRHNRLSSKGDDKEAEKSQRVDGEKAETSHGRAETTNRSQSHAKSSPEAKVSAGLYTAEAFKEDQERRKRRNELTNVALASSGRAETVYRDKKGRKLNILNELMRQKEAKEKQEKRQAHEEYEWGTGKVQKEMKKSHQQRLEEISAEPFARYQDDPELEAARKSRMRDFDPINSKTFDQDPLSKTKKHKKKHNKRRYAGPPAPSNRFGIQPGYRWDGVVRGTEWEETVLLKSNATTAKSADSYKQSVADM